MKIAYLHLFLGIITEVIATGALKATDGFRRLVPTIIVLAGYGLSFYFVSQTVKYLPLGIVYAIWSGVGIVLTAMIGVFYYKDRLDLPATLGIGLILLGVAVINIFSRTTTQ